MKHLINDLTGDGDCDESRYFKGQTSAGDKRLERDIEASIKPQWREFWPGAWPALLVLMADHAAGRFVQDEDHHAKLRDLMNNREWGEDELSPSGFLVLSMESAYIHWRWAVAYRPQRADRWREKYARRHAERVAEEGGNDDEA